MNVRTFGLVGLLALMSPVAANALPANAGSAHTIALTGAPIQTNEVGTSAADPKANVEKAGWYRHRYWRHRPYGGWRHRYWHHRYWRHRHWRYGY